MGEHISLWQTHKWCLPKDMENQFYWVGWIYAYIHFKTRLSSKTIVSGMPIKEMLINYNHEHEMSKEAYYMYAVGRKRGQEKREKYD